MSSLLWRLPVTCAHSEQLVSGRLFGFANGSSGSASPFDGQLFAATASVASLALPQPALRHHQAADPGTCGKTNPAVLPPGGAVSRTKALPMNDWLGAPVLPFGTPASTALQWQPRRLPAGLSIEKAAAAATSSPT